MTKTRRSISMLAVVLPVVLAGATAATADKDAKPSLSVRANPAFAFAPARIVLRADLKGGTDDYEDYYCPGVEWEWGDGTISEAFEDCEPYEAGKSQIKRRYVAEHTFQQAGRRSVSCSSSSATARSSSPPTRPSRSGRGFANRTELTRQTTVGTGGIEGTCVRRWLDRRAVERRARRRPRALDIAEGTDADNANAFGWTDGQLRIVDLPLKEVVPLMMRWYGLVLTPDSKPMLERKVTLSAALDSMRAAIRELQTVGNVMIDYDGKKNPMRDLGGK